VARGRWAGTKLKGRTKAPLALLFIGLLTACAVHGAGSTHAGELHGAPYVIWTPAEANGNLLVRAPGYRHLDATRAIAWDAREDPVYAELIDAGWTIATTHYRRDARVGEAGMADLVALIEFTGRAHGPFTTVIVEGEAMGGMIAIRLLEDPARSQQISGAIVFGTLLDAASEHQADQDVTSEEVVLNYRPSRPLYLVSSHDQLAGPLAYLARTASQQPRMTVAVHVIERSGQLELTDPERRRALRQIYNWVNGEPPPRLGDATIEEPLPVGSGALGNDQVRTGVLDVDPAYGNLDLDVTLNDLIDLGVGLGDRVAIRAGATTHFARIGDRYASVPTGEWVLVALPDGRLRLAVNRGNAAAALGIAPGAELLLQSVAP